MTEQEGIYNPIRLNIGHNGWVQSYDMNGLNSDILMQNICWVCREKALSIEQIARTLGVAAVYLEDKIEKLLYMDYIKTVGTNKYQTEFFILDEELAFQNAQFNYENVMEFVVPIFNMVKDKISELRENELLFGDFSDDFLMWVMVALEFNRANSYISYLVNQQKNINSVCPKRKDGSEHWVSASTQYITQLLKREDISEELKQYILNSGGSGIKTRSFNNIKSIQFDLQLHGGWRDFETNELKQISRVYEIITKEETPNEYEKDAITNLVAKGYVKVENGRPILLIPYVKKMNSENNQEEILKQYLSLLEKYLDINEIIKPIIAQVENIKKNIPSYLDKNERNHVLQDNCGYGIYGALYMLYKNGYLKKPTYEEQKRICTLIWEE